MARIHGKRKNIYKVAAQDYCLSQCPFKDLLHSAIILLPYLITSLLTVSLDYKVLGKWGYVWLSELYALST